MPDELDREVLRRFVQGDRDAFEALFGQFEMEVFRWAVRIVRDPGIAEDVVVEAFWNAYRGRARFDWSRSFGAWMRRIATNVSRDHLRAAKRTELRRLDPDTAAVPAADPAVDRTIALAFRKLPPKLQIVATLVLIEGRSHDEVAQALGIPVGTVKSRLFRATRALREELARLGVEP
jgi:RNA polymerase sigma-70 factor (ECF subfamily)